MWLILAGALDGEGAYEVGEVAGGAFTTGPHSRSVPPRFDGAGDVDGDGIADLLQGDPEDPIQEPGAAYLLLTP